jgi:hypothetical protein
MEGAGDSFSAADVRALREGRESAPDGKTLDVAVELVVDEACGVRR